MSRTTTRDYISQKNISNLFEELMRHILNAKPENPVQFLIKILQENEEKLLNKEPTPSIRRDPGFKCEGSAVDIRKSLERVIPKIPDKKLKHTNSGDRNDEYKSIIISREKLSKLKSLAEPSLDDIQVSKEVVTAVQAAKSDYSKSGSSSGSDDTIKSKSSEEKKKKKKKKKKKTKDKKKKHSDDEKKSDHDEKDEKESPDAEVNETLKDENAGETDKTPVNSLRFGEEADARSLVTLSCDLTQYGSWEPDDLGFEAESIVSQQPLIQSSSVKAVNSANPNFTKYQSEHDMLEEEGLDSRVARDTLRAGTMTTTTRVTSPCTTVFFESDDDPPLIDNPEEVQPVECSVPTPGSGYEVVDTHRSTTEIVDRNISLESLLCDKDDYSDKLSVSGLSGFGWQYAESVS